MKDKIRLLSQKVANQIAAGEVVTDTPAVIKEMMENSIDAGATEVIVNYRCSGYELIQIVDNGSGLSPNDARMAFERHATSKIRAANDVYKLNTFGFRGEALASIAAVSRVELRSRMEGDEMGTVTIIENGDCIDQYADMCETGANFVVTEIFQDTPARRRFMDKGNKSSQSLVREFRRVALCYPSIAFELHADGAPLYRLAPTTLLSRIVDVVGRSAKTTLLDIKIESSIVNIYGFIGNEKSLRKRNHDQYMFVNGRYFESETFSNAVIKGYENIIKSTHQPSFFIYFEVKPEDLDVNIHPQKTEVKFAEETSIWSILVAAVRESLARTGVVSMMEFDDESNIEIPIVEQGRSYKEPRAISNEGYNPFAIEAQIEARPPKDEMDGTHEVEFEEFESQLTAHKTHTDHTAHTSTPPRSNRSGNAAGSIRAMKSSDNFDMGWESGFEEIESRVFTDIEEVGSDQILVEYEDFESSASSENNQWESIVEEEIAPPAELPLAESHSAIQHSAIQHGAAQHEAVQHGAAICDVMVTHGRYGWYKVEGVMRVIDLKRAKERILYDHYYSMIKSAQAVSQRTLFPLTEQLTTAEYTILSENIEEFQSAGFEITLMGDDTIEICGVPAGLQDDVAKELIQEILHLLSTPEDVAESRREKIAMAMAQNGAKGMGKSISPQQATELIAQLLKSTHGGRTADGRKIIWSITPDEIKRRFK